MKKFITLLLAFSLSTGYAQNLNDSLKKTILEIKSNSKIDKNDKVALEIVNDFYKEVLQSDKGELENATIEKLQKFMASNDSKNKHLLAIFLMYQQHISETAAKGLKTDSKFQVKIMIVLEKEFQVLYEITPPIIIIYKSEALNSDQRFEEASNEIKKGLSLYPSSIALKVYSYIGTKDESIKKDLIMNHSNHWLVQQNNIK